MSSERLMIAHLQGLNGPDTQFTKWPLHVTLLPWFRLSTEEALGRFDVASKRLRAFSIVLGEKTLGNIAMYGQEEDVPVRPIKDSTALGVVHGILLLPFFEALEDTTFVGSEYNPHMTIRSNDDPGEGYELFVSDLSLVRHDGDHKTVVKTHMFESESEQ